MRVRLLAEDQGGLPGDGGEFKIENEDDVHPLSVHNLLLLY